MGYHQAHLEEPLAYKESTVSFLLLSPPPLCFMSYFLRLFALVACYHNNLPRALEQMQLNQSQNPTS